MSYTKKIEKALKKKPETIGDLACLIGKGENIEKEILQGLKSSQIKIKPTIIDKWLILVISLLVFLLLEIFPRNSISNYLSLLVLLVLPYFWTNELLKKLHIDNKLTIGLVIAELMGIGLIVGSLGLLNQQVISFALVVSTIIKYIAIELLSYDINKN